MTARGARSIKSAAVLFAALLCLAGARNAQAQTPGCMVDTDCPNSACGGDVCTHTTSGGFACNPANTQAGKGFDGWCADADGVAHDEICKCKGLGATCASFFCTFTVPVDAPMAGTGGSSAGGAAGGGAAGAAGSSAGGRGGTTGGAAGTTGGSGGRAGGGDGGGCNVSGAASATGDVVGFLLLVAASVRRRRSGAVR
jgi:hypothetical protein